MPRRKKWAYHGTARQRRIAVDCALDPQPSEDDGRPWLFFTDTPARASYYAHSYAKQKDGTYKQTRSRGVVFRFPWPKDARTYNFTPGEGLPEEWTTAAKVPLDQAQVRVGRKWRPAVGMCKRR